MADSKPLVALDGTGEPAILNYNVPEPTSYSGRNLMELRYPKSKFKELIGQETPPPKKSADPTKSAADMERWMEAEAAVSLPSASRVQLKPAASLPSFLAEAPSASARSRRPGAATASSATSEAATNTTPSRLDPVSAAAMTEAGKLPYLVPTVGGDLKVVYADTSGKPYPGLYLVEYYRLSNYLGDYGAGKTVQTFSLLPGEKTKISITTFRNTSSTSSTTSSIFDSYTTTTETAFESMVQAENSHTESKEKAVEWHVEAEASANLGIVGADVSSGVSGSTNSAREDFAKNVSTATQKHSQIASAQRDISVNTSMTTTEETGEQTAIEREISNLNVGRTLNFVFRQLNQEHISILHLVDVRVAFYNGYPDTRMEVPLHEIDELLEYCVAKAEDRKQMKDDVLYALSNIVNYQNRNESLIIDRVFTEPNGQKNKVKVINRDLVSVYDPARRQLTVPGIILAVNKVVLRTDAVIVEALLGEAEALDEYSRGLQDEKVREQRLANDLRAIELAERKARLAVLEAKDGAAADVYQKLFGAPAAPDPGDAA